MNREFDQKILEIKVGPLKDVNEEKEILDLNSRTILKEYKKNNSRV